MSAINKNPANVQTIDYAKHGKLKVKPNPGFAQAKERNLAAVNVAELGICSSNFPLVFVRHPTDKQHALMAILGLKHGENVFYGAEYWESTYVPLVFQRHPFIVGFDERVEGGEQLAACIEMDSPLLSETEGLPLFDADGKESAFLRNRNEMLSNMFEAGKFTGQFIQKLVELDLIVSLVIALQGPKGEVHKLTGLYTIDEARLKNLDAAQLKDLQARDFLGPCYLMLVSLYQLNQLIRRRNRMGKEPITGFRIELNGQEPAAGTQA